MTNRNRSLVGLVLAAFAFLLLARWVASGDALPFDTGIRAAVHVWAWPPLTRGMVTVTTLGSEYFLIPLGAILIGLLATTGRRRQAVLLPVVSLSAAVLSELLKLAMQRPRPPVFFGLAPAENYSFPSGHAFLSTVFYGTLASIFIAGEPSRRKRAVMAAMAVAAALMVGFSRVYLGYHYPSDVLGGWACGVAWLCVARLTLTRSPEHAPRQTQKEHH